MADRPARRPPPASPPPQPSAAAQRKAKVVLSLLAMLLAWLILSLPTLIVFVVGMMPSIVAMIVDRSEEKYSTICVGAINFCGVFPYLLKLLAGDHSVAAASGVVTNVFTIVVMYGAAGFGWMLFMSIPPVVSAFLTVVAQRKIAALRASQRHIVEEWGDAVAKETETPGRPKTRASHVAPRRARA